MSSIALPNAARILAVITALALLAGCSTNVSRFQVPGTDLADVKALHIVPPEADEREAEQIMSLIEANLRERGYEISIKDDAITFADGDYVFDYTADWHWDITWYLLELRVAIYDPVSDTLIAQAHSQQTSLVRKSVDVVVDRAMASLFDDPVPEDGEE